MSKVNPRLLNINQKKIIVRRGQSKRPLRYSQSYWVKLNNEQDETDELLEPATKEDIEETLKLAKELTDKFEQKLDELAERLHERRLNKIKNDVDTLTKALALLLIVYALFLLLLTNLFD